METSERLQSTISHSMVQNSYSQVSQQSKPRSLSQISGLHSHRNMKISHQLQLAESMYEPNIRNSLDSRLSYNLNQCLSDDVSLPYFLQYIESLDKLAKNIVTCFIQVNCLMAFLKENFTKLNFDQLEHFELDDRPHNSYFTFLDDFIRLYNHFSLLCGDAELLIIPNELRDRLKILSIGDSNKESNQFEDENKVHLRVQLKLFHNFWKCLYDEIESKYYQSFLRSNFYLNKNLELSDIVHSNTGIASTFLDFMNSEDMKIFVDFLIMHKNYKSYSRQRSDALALYDRFFNHSTISSQRSFLDFSDNILQRLKVTISEDAFDPDCFDIFAYILIQYFTKTYLPQFIQNESFIEYLKSCQTKMKSHSTKMYNSTGTGTNSSCKLAKSESNASSQSNDLTHSIESDYLWKRSLKGQLQFTYIDNYGRMNSLFEHEPTKINPNGKLTNVIKRLTSNTSEEKKKEEEEDAWRIAESIINDVCSVTIDQADINGATKPMS
ncbi:A-kinase anchor protein 10, mitochondrial [Blomia tropicalis]|nr:A-kinase anchor protein 10, mitochondrial [Blomia tropicalis]